jgi:D-glycero-D-manno-heptose 1,7-bisphosphate phosphatase
MLVAAAEQLGIALHRSFMVGDRASDIAAGRAAGCKTVFLDLDYTAEPKPDDADFSVRSLRDATACILAANLNEVHHAAT